MGTTINILAPYLPYKLEVEINHQDGHLIERAEVLGLISWGNKPAAKISYTKPTASLEWQMLENLTPVLRSFDQLVTPLEDGSIPAQIVAELLGGVIKHATKFQYEGDSFYLSAWLDEEAGVSRAGWNLWLSKHWLSAGDMPVRVADYLRSVHFAVGLQDSDYIRKGA